MMRRGYVLTLLLIISVAVLTGYSKARAQSADDLQAQIDKRNADIASLDADIKSYQKQIDALGTQATSLSATIKSLQLNQKQLEAKIAVTQDQIAEKNAEILQLGGLITHKEGNIEDDQRIVKQTFLTLDQAGDTSLLDIFLGSNSISSALDGLDALGILQKNVYGRIASLSSDKAALQSSQDKTVKAKADLVALNNQLADQRKIVLSTAAQTNTLLKQTSQSESSYKQMLADKLAQEQAMQAEINQYEQQLHLLVNASQIPKPGPVLAWPLDSIYITQYFGNTPFATANPQIYGGIGHDGVDFRAAIGTPIKAALSGVVIGVENTDSYPGCYSFGKWVMIKHADGLSTLYAHLSLQSVSVGQQISTGDLVGYSGNTGYTTGPHLHFGVYATAGTVIKLFTQSKHCQGATIPIADYTAYLNPLSYLPAAPGQ